jgi:hypothetical protein
LQELRPSNHGIHSRWIGLIRYVIHAAAQRKPVSAQRNHPLNRDVEIEINWKMMRIYSSNNQPIRVSH